MRIGKISRFGRRLSFSILFLLPVLLMTWIWMGPLAESFQPKNTRAVIFVIAALLGAVILKRARKEMGWVEAFVWTALAYGVVYRMAVFIPDVSTYPWSLGWSEGSRYYYASLFFADKVYGIPALPSVLHPSRYLMQSAPFLLPEIPLWTHRLWQVLLWIGFNLWAAVLVARRFKTGWGLAFLAFLFFFQGPVYYHLQVMVIVVFWGTDTRSFWKTLAVVLLASAWAGISRLNWFPVPGMMAAALYFIEQPVNKRNWLAYLLPAALWTIAGTGVAFTIQTAYIYLSGNPAEQFGSSLSSDLLWYRLWPSPTYPAGVVRSIIRITFPVALIILARWLPNTRRFHSIRILGMIGILAVLLAGGIIVSVKIGGGSNLHNVDAYLVLLLVTGAAFYTRQVLPEESPGSSSTSLRAQGALWPLVFFMILFPLRDVTMLGGALLVRDVQTASTDLETLRAAVQQAARQGGEVLFIDQRHLLAMHMVEDVPLVEEYEVVFLMEMVMGNNQPYLKKFYTDLRQGRFAYIVNGTPRIHYQDETVAFSEENNLWVDRVTVPLLCYYEIGLELPDSGMSLMVPRQQPCK